MTIYVFIAAHECSPYINHDTQNGNASQFLSHNEMLFWKSLQGSWCTLLNITMFSSRMAKKTQVKLDYNAEMWTLFVALPWAIGHQAFYTSLWSAVTSRVPLSTTCCWKKWLVHVRIHNPVWKIFINVVTSCLELFSNLSATRAKQCHSREWYQWFLELSLLYWTLLIFFELYY